MPRGPRPPRPRRRIVAYAVLTLGLTVAACSSPALDDSGQRADQSPGASSPSEPVGPQPKIRRVSPERWEAMRQAGMVRPECPVQHPSELRVVAINHYNFEGEIRRGHLVVNADVAESIVRIFSDLFDAEFPIRRMSPVEAFDGDTNASLRADNTSAFNCRRSDQINAPFGASPHANGRAIDINPRENPWMDLRCDCWLPSAKFADRVDRPGGINRGGLVWRLFKEEGWIWQNIDVPDYMHFDTGYPSAPFDG